MRKIRVIRGNSDTLCLQKQLESIAVYISFGSYISFYNYTIRAWRCVKGDIPNTNPGGGNMIHAFNVCRHCLDSPQKKTPRSCLLRLHLTVDLNGHSITFLNAHQFAKCFKYLSQSVSTAVLLTELKHQSNEFQDTAGLCVSQEC